MIGGTRYARAATIEEACSLLASDDMAKVLAGGQSLVPMMSLGLARPSLLVDIGRVSDAPTTGVVDGFVQVGPTCRHVDLETTGTPVDRAAPLLAQTAPWIAHAAIRSRGTFLGSVAHGDPAAEWPAVALALDAELELRSVRGMRRVGAADFFLGPLTTAMDPDEVLVAARWPVAPAGTRAATRELTLRHGDYAVVGVVAQLTTAEDGAIRDARIGLLGVGPTPIRAHEAEAILVANGGGAEVVREAAALAARPTDPASDVAASSGYRRRMVEVFVRRAVLAALGEPDS